MAGQYLTLLMGDAEPLPRDHFTLGYNQYVIDRMFDDYVLKDAGGPLPRVPT